MMESADKMNNSVNFAGKQRLNIIVIFLFSPSFWKWPCPMVTSDMRKAVNGETEITYKFPINYVFIFP